LGAKGSPIVAYQKISLAWYYYSAGISSFKWFHVDEVNKMIMMMMMMMI